MNTPELILDAILEMARTEGAKYPAFADLEGTGGEPMIVDTDTGRTWAIKLDELA